MDKRIVEISDNLRRGVTMPHLQRAIDNVTRVTRMNERCACGKHAVACLEAKYPACPTCLTEYKRMTPLERLQTRSRWSAR